VIYILEDNIIFIQKKGKKNVKVKCEDCNEYIRVNVINLHKAGHNRESDFIFIETAYKGRFLIYHIIIIIIIIIIMKNWL
jgi:hypothetical protein